MVIMKKLFQLLGLNKPNKGTLGIEIEVEGKNLNAVHDNFWHSEDDGSLRGYYPETRAEYVLNEPIKPDEVVPALQQLVAALPDAKFDFSYRTSVHVHVNVQELNHTQILNMIYTYLVLEEPLMTYCGKFRKGNRFCLRLADAEGLLDSIQKMVKDRNTFYAQVGENFRYSAINLASLQKYGSIEFRGMRGNIEIPVIHTWTRALLAIKDFAEAQESPKTILALLEKLGAKGFLIHVLGDEVSKAFIYPRVVKDMAKSYSISLDIPYSYQPPPVEAPPRVAKPGEVVVNDNGDRLWNGIYFLKNTHQIQEYQQEGTIIVFQGQKYVYENRNFSAKGPYLGEKPPEEPKPVRVKRPVNVIIDDAF